MGRKQYASLLQSRVCCIIRGNGKTASLQDRIRLAKAMNDMLMQDYAMIPLIHRGGVSAHSNTISGVRMNEWDSELWNIADWKRNEAILNFSSRRFASSRPRLLAFFSLFFDQNSEHRF